MAPIELKVSLINGALDVEDIPNGGVSRGDDIQPIVWYLDPDTLPDAYFESVTGSPRPFTWISTPHWSIFNNPTRIDPRHLLLEDNHTGSRTHGNFIYMLRVRGDSGFPATYYTTTHTPNTADFRTVNNPVIINK